MERDLNLSKYDNQKIHSQDGESEGEETEFEDITFLNERT